jgi:hypothetical protein
MVRVDEADPLQARSECSSRCRLTLSDTKIRR